MGAKVSPAVGARIRLLSAVGSLVFNEVSSEWIFFKKTLTFERLSLPCECCDGCAAVPYEQRFSHSMGMSMVWPEVFTKVWMPSKTTFTLLTWTGFPVNVNCLVLNNFGIKLKLFSHYLELNRFPCCVAWPTAFYIFQRVSFIGWKHMCPIPLKGWVIFLESVFHCDVPCPLSSRQVFFCCFWNHGVVVVRQKRPHDTFS